MQIFAFRCAECGEAGDEWVDEPKTLQCPECGEKSYHRVWSFNPLRSGQEAPPGSR